MRKSGEFITLTTLATPTCCSCSKKITQKQKLLQQEMS